MHIYFKHSGLLKNNHQEIIGKTKLVNSTGLYIPLRYKYQFRHHNSSKETPDPRKKIGLAIEIAIVRLYCLSVQVDHDVDSLITQIFTPSAKGFRYTLHRLVHPGQVPGGLLKFYRGCISKNLHRDRLFSPGYNANDIFVDF